MQVNKAVKIWLLNKHITMFKDEREITKAATFVTGLLSGFARKRTVFDMIVT